MFGRRSAGSAIRLLQRAARDVAFQSQTGIPPIWVSGQVMDPWLTYDGIWIAGCGEDRWPPPIDPVPLIPVPLQREHGVHGAAAAAQLEFAVDLQARWHRRAGTGVYSCADPGDGRSLPLSPLLPAGPAATAVHAAPQPHWRALAARAPDLDRLDDAQAPAFRAGERTQGVATLRAQSLCPFRGLATTRLLAPRLDRPAPGFNGSERGNMVHDALQYLWSELRSWARLAAVAPGEREALIEQGALLAIRRQSARRDPGERWRQRESPRLRALLDKWLRVELQREPFEVLRLEQEAQTARFGGLEFKIRIDRMDRLTADGGRVLIDYKTGTVKTDWRGDRPENPQLPLYALLHPESLVAVAYGRVDAGDPAFVAEAEREGIFKPRSRRSSLEGRESFAALIGLWARRIDALAAEFAAGHAAVAPLPHACASCHLQGLCRIPSALALTPDTE
jgi:probable DNA repair protein